MIDLALLQICRRKADFDMIHGRIPKSALDPQTQRILKSYETYFKNFPNAAQIDVQKFLPIFRADNVNLDEEKREAYEKILTKIAKPVSKEDRDGVMISLLDVRFATDIANTLAKWEAGDLPNILGHVKELYEQFEADAALKGIDYVRPDLKELLEQSQETNGLQFRLQCLKDSMRGLRGGDFGILAGRPDKGKTTFLADSLTYMAAQIESDRPILWLNNEGPGNRIFLRLVQAALGKTVSQIRAMADPLAEYQKAINSPKDPYKIRIVDIHRQDNYAVERIIKDQNPALVVYDMIDNIAGFGDSARTDIGLERMYQWARELCVKYDTIGIGTSQISNEGDGEPFPPMGALKDSKTGKQGACDFQMMIGAMNNPDYDPYRYISLPKNKLSREGAAKDPRAQVLFRPQIARFEDMPVKTLEEDQ